MARQTFTVSATATPPDEIVERAIERQQESDGNEPLETFLRDHIDYEIEWDLPEELRPDDTLRCIS